MNQPFTTSELTRKKHHFSKITGIPIKSQCSWYSVLCPFLVKRTKSQESGKHMLFPYLIMLRHWLTSNLVSLHPFPSLRNMNYINISTASGVPGALSRCQSIITRPAERWICLGNPPWTSLPEDWEPLSFLRSLLDLVILYRVQRNPTPSFF